ncbi:MAG: MobF family relaxase [Verrucomicrobiota bacterium]
MITASQIKGGEGYMKRHLSANDYYCENETVIGYWRGKAAELLGIEGQAVTAEAFEALRTNKHPLTDEKLRLRTTEGMFHDIVISCPKTISIAALVGGDERLVKAFEEVVDRTFKHLESYASRRERQGKSHNTENTVQTSNGVAAVYHHDTSRLLDPQLHAHCVFSNHTWCEQAQQWYALQPREMMEQSKLSIRRAFYQDMAKECRKLGYDVHWKYDPDQKQDVPRLRGITAEMELLFSARSKQKVDFIDRYQEMFGQKPDERRVEYFIKETKGPATKRFIGEYEQAFGQKPENQIVQSFVNDWRSSKMANSSQAEVLSSQLERLRPEQQHGLKKTVQHAILSQQAMNAPAIEPLQDQGASLMSQDTDNARKKNKPQVAEPVRQTPLGKRNLIKSKSQHARVKREQTRRIEALRKIKRGHAILNALNGHPAGFIVRELTRQARKRKQR